MDSKDIVEALKNVPLFSGLDKKNLTVVSKIATPRSFDKGEVIITQGENGVGFYLITAGKVEVSREKNGDKVKLAELGAGDFFGEMALFEDVPRAATVTALEPTECYIIVRWHFTGTIETTPSIAAQMLPVIVKRLRDTEELL